MFSARWIDATTAQDWGLIAHLVSADELASKALEYANTLATRSREGIATMKSLSLTALAGNVEDGLQEEIAAATRVLLGADAKEGLASFKEKRRPNFA